MIQSQMLSCGLKKRCRLDPMKFPYIPYLWLCICVCVCVQIAAHEERHADIEEKVKTLQSQLGNSYVDLDEQDIPDLTEEQRQSADRELDTRFPTHKEDGTTRFIGADGFSGLSTALPHRHKRNLDEIYNDDGNSGVCHILDQSVLDDDENKLNSFDRVEVFTDDSDAEKVKRQRISRRDSGKAKAKSDHKEDEDIPDIQFASGAFNMEIGRCDASLSMRLMSHQKEAIQFAENCLQKDHGLVIAHTMGLGKTYGMLTLMDIIASNNPSSRFLVTTPTTIALNWQAEYDKWGNFPNLKLIPFSPSVDALKGLLRFWKDGGMLIVTLDTLRLISTNHSALWEQLITADVVVADEAHRFKNQQTQLYNAMAAFQTPYRIALTGTPVQNNLQELFGLLEWVAPGKIANDQKQFKKLYADDIEKGRELFANRKEITLGKRRTFMLRKKLDTFVHRRDDAKLNELLPEKKEFCLQIPGTSPDDKDMNYLRLLSETFKLNLNAKVDFVKRLTTILLRNKHALLIFSHRIDMLNAIATSLKEMKMYAFRVMTGETSYDDRQNMVNAFQEGKLEILLMTTKTGGFGINLTRASRVIIVDLSLNPANDEQAVRRAWRVGQQHVVHIYRIMAATTVEESTYRNQCNKTSLFYSIVDERETQLDSKLASIVGYKAGTLPILLPSAWDDNALIEMNSSFSFAVSKHSFSEDDEDNITTEEKEAAVHDINKILCTLPRTMTINERTQQIPHIQCEFEGTLLEPFPPVIGIDDNFVTIDRPIPPYPHYKLEYKQLDVDEVFKGVPVDPKKTQCLSKSIFNKGGRYVFRVKGSIDGVTYSPTSKESGVVTV